MHMQVLAERLTPSVQDQGGGDLAAEPARVIAFDALQSDELADRAMSAEEAVTLERLRHEIALAVAELPARERDLLRKHYYQDMELAEAGAELGLSKWGASRMHARAVAALRARLSGVAEISEVLKKT